LEEEVRKIINLDSTYDDIDSICKSGAIASIHNVVLSDLNNHYH